MRCTLLVLVSLSACPADEAPPLDVHGVDAPRTDRGPVKDGPVDHASSGDRRLTEAWQPDDLGFSCSGCLLEQVCVHSVNATTCQVIKSQCKYRTPSCFSPTTNPCCDCEAEVCGLWSTCIQPTACPVPTPGSFDPDRECFCYSK